MAIIYIRQKRGILGLVIWTGVIATLAVSTYFVLLHQSLQEYSTPKVSSFPIVALANEAQVAIQSERVNIEQHAVAPKMGNPHSSAVDVAPPLPKYGMNAMGADGAWDNTKEVEEKSKVDDHGNVCVNVKGYTTAVLRTMLPPPNSLDFCDYAREYRRRADQTPADVLADNEYFDGNSISRYFTLEVWTVSDIEQLARRKLSPMAALNVYLFLKQANSPVVVYLLGRRDDKIDRSAIEDYLIDGNCLGGVGPYCLLE